MALDQDAAGQQATLRSLESSWRIYQSRVAGQSRGTTLLQRPENPEIRIAAMPSGQDPDEVIRRSPAEWSRLVDEARPLLDFLISATTASIDPSTAQGKAAIAEAIFPLIAAVQDAPQQDHYFEKLAEELNVTTETLRASVGRPTVPRHSRQSQSRRQPEQSRGESAVVASSFAKLEHDPVEEYCLTLLMRYPDLSEYAETLTAEHFWRHENREIFTGYLSCGEEVAEDAPDNAPPGVREQLEALRRKSLHPMDFIKRRRAMADVITQLEKRSLRRLKTEEQIRFSESPPDLDTEDLQDTVAVNQRMKEAENRSRNRP